MENELKSLARERIWFLEQVRRKAEKSVTISNGGNFICRKVRGAFQYYLNGEYVKKAKKISWGCWQKTGIIKSYFLY